MNTPQRAAGIHLGMKRKKVNRSGPRERLLFLCGPLFLVGFSMKTALAVVVLVVCLLASGSYAQDTSRFQSVGGDLGKNMIRTTMTQSRRPLAITKPVELGKFAQLVVDGNLIGDPKYSMKKLNVTSNWLGDSFVDPYGLSAPAYQPDPQEEPVKTYVDPISGQSYYTYTDSKSGKDDLRLL